MEKHASHGLDFTFNYTYGRGHGISNFGGGGFDNAYDLRNDYGPLGFNSTHAVTLTNVWHLPYGRGQRWGSANSKALDLLLGGWSVDGITTLESGHPFSPVVSNTASVNDPDFSGVRADRVGSAHIAGQSAAEWFNVASFNNSLWGPAQYVVNLALEKTFNITENKTLEFRWENFNAFNIDNYGMPANTVDVSGTGQITSTAIPMRQMQFGLHFRF
ncbi:MAG: hypothetical protein ABSG32_30225 [Terriglobia bacterium]